MATSKLQAIEGIKRLIEKYERVKAAREIKRYDESNTRKDFIMPLFKALGWDVYNDFTDREVIEEETAIKGKVDYSFCLNNIPQFLLEAKALKENLDKLEWAKQAVTYGWNKGIPWVVLTDFESLKLFNSEWQVETPRPNLEFTYDEFLKRLDDLWFLSRESIEVGELDKQAEKWGIKTKRLKVGEKLATDLLKWRELLRKYFKLYNPKINDSDIDESVQRVLDRLIFIRVCEDRRLEPPTLWPALQRWTTHSRKPDNFMQALKPIFEDFHEKYNSNLFLEHLCEKLDTEGTPFEQIISDFYGDKEKGVKYDFSAIPADVLGTIYEQYLGYIQEKKTRKENGDTDKRKKQGIYYTPEFIVDYIVQNTLGVILKEKTLREVENIKVLDPACGSGSFLIKVFEMIDRHFKEEKAQKNAGSAIEAVRKFSIIKNNIYGVDFDSQAIEIARLNLLLKALEPNHKLPLLSNIKPGNSLISGIEKEVEKYFGKNWKAKKPFDWKEEFSEVMKSGGFDVIIGNPPWGAELLNREKDYFKNYYISAKGIIDTFSLFIERATTLLKDNGYLGFILPDIVLLKNYPAIRKYILDNFVIKNAVHSGMIFGDVNLDSTILILKKETNKKTRSQNIINVIKNVSDFKAQEWEESKIKQKLFEENENYKFNLYLTDENIKLKKKLDEISIPLNAIGESHEGIHSGNIRSKIFVDSGINSNSKRLLFRGEEITPYLVEWRGKYVNYDPSIVDKDRGEYANLAKKEYFEPPKLLIRRTGDKIIAALDENKYYASNNFFIFQNTKDKKYDLKFLLAVLNSQLTTWYFLTIQPRKGRLFAEVKIVHLNQFPIYKIDFSKQIERDNYNDLIKLVEKIINLNKDLLKCARDSDRYRVIQAEIEKVDKQINQLVYKLYGLTPEEIAIVEGDY